MKKIAKIIFKIHRLIYRYPMRSEIRLVLEYHDLIGSLWYIGMLYICGESISEARLKALPDCVICISCAEEQERNKKIYVGSPKYYEE